MNNDLYRTIRGRIILHGKRPDGDSVRFKPNQINDLDSLAFSERLRISTDDTVQLRLDGIDAPETHYQGNSQPLAPIARDGLLQTLGFDDIDFNSSGTVTEATPDTILVTILAKMVEINGRPVAYLFSHNPKTNETTSLSLSLLRQSVNAHMLQTGLAYPTFYTSTPSAHRRFLMSVARDAKAKKAGVWTIDSTSRFRLTSHQSIGPNGKLILPKLFRRCTDYLKDKADQPELSFLEWLQAATSRGLSEDDELFVGMDQTRLSQVIQEDNEVIRFTVDLLDITFIEK